MARQLTKDLRECINAVHELANNPRYVNNRDARTKFAHKINIRLEEIWRELDNFRRAL